MTRNSVTRNPSAAAADAARSVLRDLLLPGADHDARLLATLRPGGRPLQPRFPGKRAAPLLWAADIVAGAVFHAAPRGAPAHADALGPVERHDC